VKNGPLQFAASRHASIGKVLLEAVGVAVAGLAFAFAANEISPRGLAVARNYFPPATDQRLPVAGINLPGLSVSQQVETELKVKGLQTVDLHRATQLFHDPSYLRDAIVFIDARGEQDYREGHIPGAHEFDPYRPEKYFSAVLPACQAADQIIVYCHGGDCDDSVSAAILLRDVGIANAKLLVFTGGITEWTTNGLPVEKGARNSGDIRKAGT
jgi:rhodanese-related sulfurtransferase